MKLEIYRPVKNWKKNIFLRNDLPETPKHNKYSKFKFSGNNYVLLSV